MSAECVDAFSPVLLTNQIFQACFIGKEYVVTQPINPYMDDTSVQSILRAEYGLLCVGNTLKQEFNCHAQECGTVTISGKHFPLVYELKSKSLMMNLAF